MQHTPNNRKVLLIGWDAADWRVINPLIEQGKMPNLKRYLDTAISGNVATLRPILSPMLWTSIATGKRPFKHGIHGFTEPMPNGKAIRPITNLSRKTKAIWNILNQCGKKSIVVGWWPSHPAEPIDGVMVSNHYQRANAPLNKPWPMQPGTVHPDRLATHLEEFRFHPGELTGDHIAPFIPLLNKVDQQKDKRLVGLAKTVADCTSIHGAATALIQLEPWDFMAVYYDGIDHFGHGFMKYHPPRQDWISEEDFEIYSNVIEAGYRFHDSMLGVLIKLAGPDTTVILMSDHGFHPDHLRPRHIPVEPAGPAIEHREFGILAIGGPGIKKGEALYGASLLDVCPTILSLYNLPVGADMDGKPLVTIFEDTPKPEVIDSWDDVEGASGMHPPDKRQDATENAEAIKQLVALGYIEEPDEDASKAVDECVRELKYNLAQSYTNANRYVEAALILEELWTRWPEEHRFGTLLIECFGALDELAKRADAIDTLEKNARHFRQDSLKKLEELKPDIEKYRTPDLTEEPEPPVHDELADLPGLKQDADQDETPAPQADAPEPPGDSEAQGAGGEGEGASGGDGEMPRKLQFQLRKLSSLAAPREPLIRWLRATQAMAEGDTETCLALLEPLASAERTNPSFYLHLASAYAKLERWDQAKASYEKALTFDPENARAFLGIAEADFGAENWDSAIDAALSATELLYHNPRAHALLGTALMRTGDFDHAEKALGVALAQAPNYVIAHRALAELFTRHTPDEDKAKHHREKAKQVRRDVDWDKAMQRLEYADPSKPTLPTPDDIDQLATPWPDADPNQVITIVSGLPRSGTSMMMQMLAAGGLPPFTDKKRTPDSDNPEGYYEHEKATQLQRDQSWVPDARGKTVKVVAQLLPFLPPDQKYQIIFMKRDLREVIASQRTMLERLGKTGAALDDDRLMAALTKQIDTVLKWVAASQDHIRFLQIDYPQTIADPEATASSLNTFLTQPLDAQAMTAAVKPSLRRQRQAHTDQPR